MSYCFLYCMSSSNPSLFDNAASQFVETQDIHDLCSKQVASFIKSSGWVRSEDRVMVWKGVELDE